MDNDVDIFVWFAYRGSGQYGQAKKIGGLCDRYASSAIVEYIESTAQTAMVYTNK